MQRLGLIFAGNEEENVARLVDDRPCKRNPPGIFLRNVIGNSNPDHFVESFRVREK